MPLLDAEALRIVELQVGHELAQQVGQAPGDRGAQRVREVDVGVAQADRQVGLRAGRVVVFQDMAVLLQVGVPQLVVPAPGIHRAQRAGEVLLHRPLAADAQDLEVRRDPVGERLQVVLQLDLTVNGETWIAGVAQLVDRPGVVQRGAEDDVVDHVRVQALAAHRITRRCPAGITIVLPSSARRS